MMSGEAVIENFGYAVEELELPEMSPAGPTGRMLRVRDLLINTEPIGPMPGMLLRIRFLNQAQFDEFARKMSGARISIASANALSNGGLDRL